LGQRDYSKLYNAVPIFKALAREEVDEIVSISKMFKARSGHVLLEEGKSGHGAYIIVQGEASIHIRLYQGDDTHIATLGKGDVVGEMSLIDDAPVSATVTTTTQCIVLHIQKDKFDELRSAFRPAAYKLLRAMSPMLCERLRAINERIGSVFKEPERHMKLMEKRYQHLSSHAGAVDAPTE